MGGTWAGRVLAIAVSINMYCVFAQVKLYDERDIVEDIRETSTSVRKVWLSSTVSHAIYSAIPEVSIIRKIWSQRS